MTVSSQLTLLEELTLRESSRHNKEEKLILVGSSLGGLVATILAKRLHENDKYRESNLNLAGLCLLAPGFGITERWKNLIGEEGLNLWKLENKRLFMHHARGKEEALSYRFAADLESHPEGADVTDNQSLKFTVPTIIFHGIHDDTVPFEYSRQAKELNKTNADLQLYELEDGHELVNSLPFIWSRFESSFLS